MSLLTRKQALREKIWNQMESSGLAIFPLPCQDRIPNFVGAQAAAQKLRELEEWRRAETIFANPDSPQRPVRENALKDGKQLIMASPRLKKGFLLITPEEVYGKEHFASTIKGAFRFGAQVQEFLKPEIVVQGSVAVNPKGHRLGKGHGYGDTEIRTLKNKFGNVLVATTVHDAQVVQEIPVGEDDEKVSIIATPKQVIYVSN